MINPLSSSTDAGAQLTPISGVARKGRRTKELIKRLRPGDIAVIDHSDIDPIAASNIVDARVAAVIDCSPPITGKYPNRGPLMLVSAGIPLYKLLDAAVFEEIVDSKRLSVDAHGNVMQLDRRHLAAVEQWTKARITLEMDVARVNLGHALEEFSANTLSYVREEKHLLIDPIDAPPLTGVRSLNRRHVVVVVRGEGYKEDLQSIRSYIRDVRPILIGVDGGADVLIENGLRPDIILGDMDSVSDGALTCGAKVVVHAYASDKRAPGLVRVDALGVESELFPVSGTSEDAAMLLAYEKGARLIVAVGTHSNLEDFLDKGRAGMASTFLVRLKVGSRLVDARGVSQLHRRSATYGEVAGLLFSAGAVLAALISQSPLAQSFISFFRAWLRLRFH
ncbi:MAG: putative cytokinetic ring protein SteA [Capsulimonadaceae bacterium]|nr:putative cytokinetic ring protein SteA [Capsulimonadaceae bacterium]